MDLSSSQQKKIRSFAQTTKATFQIGKNQINDAFLAAVVKALEMQELIKIHVLNNAGMDKKAALEQLKDVLEPDYSYSIGNQLVVFKQARDKENRKISVKL